MNLIDFNNIEENKWEDLDNKYRKLHGESTYQELLDKIDKLEVVVENQRDTIEQYQEHQETIMQKYFNSDGIL